MSSSGGGAIVLSTTPQIVVRSGKTLNISTTGVTLTLSSEFLDALVPAAFSGLSGVSVASLIYDPD